MEKKEPGLFDQIEGLRAIDPNTLSEFEREMTENVIPRIVEDIDKRSLLAAESRQRQLETPASPDQAPNE